MSAIDVGELTPVTPGDGPFNIKGVSYIGHMQWIDEHFPGGKAAFIAALPEPLRPFFKQSFIAPKWYDFFPLVSAGHVCARVLGKSFHDFIVMRARYQAELDTRGVYSLLFKLAPNRTLARKAPAALEQYFDFCNVEIIADQPKHMAHALPLIPTMLVPWMSACLTGFVETVLAQGGAKGVLVSCRSESKGSAHGYPASTLFIEVAWS